MLATSTRTVGVVATVLVLAASAVAGAARAAGPTAAELRADTLRGAALNARYGNAVTRLSAAEFAAVYRNGGWRLQPEELAALVARSQGMNRLAATGVFAAPVTPAGGDGFDWGDFGIGAGGMFGVVLLAAGLLARYGRTPRSMRVS